MATSPGASVRRSHLRTIGLSATLVLTACGGGGSSTPPASTFAPFVPAAAGLSDQAEVDLGMRSASDAPSFGNYQPQDPFGVDDAIALFGAAAICESPEGDCVVKAKAQAWIDKVAQATQGGVCEGMALWSLDRYLAGAQPVTAALTLDTEVNDRIVRLFATQFLPQVSDEARANRGLPLGDFVTRLQERLTTGQGVTMGIYSDLGGHTLVPYAVDDLGDNRVIVSLYDPNWPGQERYLELDLGADTWRYSFSSEDQTNDPEAWFGTGRQIDFVALDRREAPFPEAFEGSGSGQVVLTITTTTRNWVIRDGDTVLADATTSPGDGVVDSVIRGAFGTTTVVATLPADPQRRVEVTTELAATVTVETPAGSIRLTTDAALDVTVTPAPSPEVAIDEGEGVVVATTATGRVQADIGPGVSLIVSDDEVRYRPNTNGDEVAIDLAGDTRRDVTVTVATEDGTPQIDDVPVPTLPAEVRTAEDDSLVASLQAVEPEPESTTTTTTVVERTTTTSTATTVPPTVTPSTVAPATTRAPSPVPATTTAPTTTTSPTTTMPPLATTTTTTTPRATSTSTTAPSSTTTTTTTVPLTTPPAPSTTAPPSATTPPTTTMPPEAPSFIALGPDTAPGAEYRVLIGLAPVLTTTVFGGATESVEVHVDGTTLSAVSASTIVTASGVTTSASLATQYLGSPGATVSVTLYHRATNTRTAAVVLHLYSGSFYGPSRLTLSGHTGTSRPRRLPLASG